MIITENTTLNGIEVIHNYSDAGFFIQKVGTQEIYVEAYDLPTSGYTYVETDTPIEPPSDEVE